MSKGIFYIHNNTPVIATERRPEPEEFAKKKYSSTVNIAEYLKAIREWESHVVEVKNYYRIRKDKMAVVIYPIEKYLSVLLGIATPGQAIEYEGNVIHKIIQT